MPIFPSLGSIINVPTLQKTVSDTINKGASSIVNYAQQNFNIPSPSKLATELTAKLGLGGEAAKFTNLLASGGNVAEILNTTASTTQSVDSVTSSASVDSTELMVKIKQDPAVPGSPNLLVFHVMPRIDESGQAEYDQLIPMHHPGAIQKYRYSSARTWSVSGRLVSRTSAEATVNLQLLNMIRAWRMPFYGEGTGSDVNTAFALGAPPPILTLSAYGPTMIGPVKCVLTNYNWTFDNTLDWIPSEEGNPFPVILDVSLSLTESWSPAEFSGFNLAKFKAGDLSESGAFKNISYLPPPETQAVSANDISNTSEPVEITQPSIKEPSGINDTLQWIANRDLTA